MNLSPPTAVCDDVVFCLAQEGPDMEGFCGVSISTVVDGDTVGGAGDVTQSQRVVLKKKREREKRKQFDLHVINREEAA